MFWKKKSKPISTTEFDTEFKHVTFSCGSASHSPHIISNEYSRLIKDAEYKLKSINKVNHINVDAWNGLKVTVEFPERLGLKNNIIQKTAGGVITLNNDFLIKYVKTIDPENLKEISDLKLEIKSLELERDKFNKKYK